MKYLNVYFIHWFDIKNIYQQTIIHSRLEYVRIKVLHLILGYTELIGLLYI